MAENKNIYPNLVINNNQNPSRLFAFPFIGIIIKFILLIPVAFVAIIYAFAFLFYFLVLPFYILFTGKYWDSAYDFILGFMKFSTKILLYLYGLTDKYPGFGLSDDGIFTLSVEKPKNPSRLFGFPILGFFIRAILLIPYNIFNYVLIYGAQVAVFISWFAVLFTGKYPESLYEFEKDNIRVRLATQVYMIYLSDEYPSFYMSIKNKTVKILLILAGALLLLLNQFSRFANRSNRNSDYKYNYNNYKNSTK